MESLGKREWPVEGWYPAPPDNSIEAILEEKDICGLPYCLVQWRGLPPYAATWESREKLLSDPCFREMVGSRGGLTFEQSIESPGGMRVRLGSEGDDNNFPNRDSNRGRGNKKGKKRRTKNGRKKITKMEAVDTGLDEDSTSVNDIRGGWGETQEGGSSPLEPEKTHEFNGEFGTKLTVKFPSDLLYYYLQAGLTEPVLRQKSFLQEKQAVPSSPNQQIKKTREITGMCVLNEILVGKR